MYQGNSCVHSFGVSFRTDSNAEGSPLSLSPSRLMHNVLGREGVPRSLFS